MPISTPRDLIEPNIELVGIDDNAFAIIGTVAKALKRAGNSQEVVDAFKTEAMSGDYDHVIETAMAYNGDL